MNNTDVTIPCPHCGESFQLTQALAAPLLDAERKKLEAQAQHFVEHERAAVEAKARAAAEAEYAEERQTMQQAMAERDVQVQATKAVELAARKAKSEADTAKRDVELAVQRQVQEATTRITQEAMAKAGTDMEARIKSLRDDLSAKDTKLQAAQQAEIEARRAKADAEEAKREIELQVTRQLDAERTKVREAAIKEHDEEHRLQLAEKDLQLQAMNKQVEELRRKGASGSQQMAGEVLELDLEQMLRQAFPQDRFEPVPKGQNGADLVQTVMSVSGSPSGKIVWECKRTKNWDKKWLSKLRDDQRAVVASLAVIATEAMPDDVSLFDCVEDVWVTSLPTVLPLAGALRSGLLDTAKAQRASTITDSAKDRVFQYLLTPQFRQRVTRVVEAHEEMRSDLEREKRSMTKMWGKREKQLERVIGGVSGMYGDFLGIVGTGMPVLDKLDLPGLEHDDDTDPGIAHEAEEASAAESANLSFV